MDEDIKNTENQVADEKAVHDKQFCVKCGKELNPEMQFCPGCGNKVSEKTKNRKKFIFVAAFLVVLAIVLFAFCLTGGKGGKSNDPKFDRVAAKSDIEEFVYSNDYWHTHDIYGRKNRRKVKISAYMSEEEKWLHCRSTSRIDYYKNKPFAYVTTDSGESYYHYIVYNSYEGRYMLVK